MIRAAIGDDLPALAALERDLFGVDAWHEEALAAELEGSGRTVLVSTGDGGRVEGYVVLLVVGEVGDLLRLGVRPDLRRRGVGTRLLTEALAAARGVERLLLEVSAGNADALAFYARRGFTELDRRPRYYRDGSDAVILQRPLEP